MFTKSDDESCCKISKTSIDLSQHWNRIYTNSETEQLGWYEHDPNQSIKLIDSCRLAKNSTIFIPGAGNTTLIDALLKRNYSNIIANDISDSALSSLQIRLGNSNAIEYMIDDLISPNKLASLKEIDLWIDRAVLHFFTKEEEQKAYFNLLRKLIKVEGFVIFAEFSKVGAKKCSGLDVLNYDVEMFQERLGNKFNLLNTFEYSYIMPSGDSRPYVYTLFQRK